MTERLQLGFPVKSSTCAHHPFYSIQVDHLSPFSRRPSIPPPLLPILNVSEQLQPEERAPKYTHAEELTNSATIPKCSAVACTSYFKGAN